MGAQIKRKKGIEDNKENWLSIIAPKTKTFLFKVRKVRKFGSTTGGCAGFKRDHCSVKCYSLGKKVKQRPRKCNGFAY